MKLFFVNQTSLSSVIQYYKSCYQASFFTGLGYGLFDHADVQPLAVLSGSSDDVTELDEEWVSKYLFDEDQMNLVLIENLIAIPEPNRSATTQAHYIPGQVYNLNDWATQKLADKVIDTELQTQLMINQRSVTESIKPAKLPSANGLVKWIEKYLAKTSTMHVVQLSIVALVPKNFKAAEHKAEFVSQVDLIAKNHKSPTSLLSHLFLNKPLKTTPAVTPSALPFLSGMQNQALTNVFENKVSLIKGPPGTGKSYTLATIAAQLVASGKSVLLTSHSDHALSVLRNKLIDDLGLDAGFIVHIGPGRRAGRLSQQLNRAASKRQKDNRGQTETTLETAWRTYQQISSSLQKAIHREPDISAEVLIGKQSLVDQVKKWFWSIGYDEKNSLNKQINQQRSAVDDLKSAFFAHVNSLLVQSFYGAFSASRSQWSALIQGLKKNSMKVAAQASKRGEQTPFLPGNGLKIWLVKLDEIPEHTYGLFDAVIIDEATQANMAEIIPAIAMANQLIVAGDPRQLRHYSFVSREQEQRIAQSLKLTDDDVTSYRSTSFLDFTEHYLLSSGQVNAITLLDEHYRSAPPLMNFNSEVFYEGGVQVLTGLQEMEGPCLHLHWRYIDGVREDKVNVTEAAAVLNELAVIIEKERHLASDEKTTLGVLSFFRDQTEYLKKAILNECSLTDIKAHKIKIGTPFSFQGEERDHMLISCSVDDDVHHGTWGYLNKPDVFNVATSRARHRQTLFLSADPKKLPSQSVLRAYHDFSIGSRKDRTEQAPSGAWYKDLLSTLKKIGFEVAEDRRIADIPIDLIAEANGNSIAIDLIGFPGDVGDSVHLNRYQALQRAGIPLFPLTAKEWLVSKQTVLGQLHEWVGAHKSALNVSPTKGKVAVEQKLDRVLVRDDLWQRFVNFQQAPEIIAEFGQSFNDLDQKLDHTEQLLGTLFQPGSLTYVRYQSAVNSVLEKFLDNLDTFSLLHTQVWEGGTTDHSYWKSLISPIKERYRESNVALLNLYEKLQHNVAAQTTDDFALNDLENLAERLKDYQ